MNLSFLIITYSKGNFGILNDCISSIRQFYKDEKIVIIDNFNTHNPNLGENIHYHSNKSNLFELGVIFEAFRLYPEVDRWITIHDSCKFINRLPVDIYQTNNNLFIPFWCDVPESYSPVMPRFISKLNNISIDYERYSNKDWQSVCGLMAIFDKSIIERLKEIKLDSVLPTKKIEAVCSETLFGFCINNLLEINFEPIHDGPISDYIHGKRQWTFIQKFTQGLGPVKFGQIKISRNYKIHPANLMEFNNQLSQDELVNSMVKNIVSDDEKVNELVYLDADDNILVFEDYNPNGLNMHTLYLIARHRISTYKFFRKNYNKIYN